MSGDSPQQPKDVLDAMMHSPIGKGIAGLLMGPAMFGGAGRPEAPGKIMESLINTALQPENTAKIYTS